MVRQLLALWACLLALSTATLSTACVAQAQHDRAADADEAEPEAYRKLIGQALEEYDAHNFAEARALFLRAHELVPSARTMRGLGMAEFELRNYSDSVARLREALESSDKRLSGELRYQTEQLLARALTYVAHLTVETQPVLRKGVRISIDAEPTDRQPGQLLTLSVGEHVLLVQAPGYHDEKRSLSVKGAEQKRVVIELRARGAAPLATEVRLGEGAEARPLRKNPWLWTGLAALVVGGVVASVLLTLPPDRPEAAPIPGDIGGVVQTFRKW